MKNDDVGLFVRGGNVDDVVVGVPVTVTVNFAEHTYTHAYMTRCVRTTPIFRRLSSHEYTQTSSAGNCRCALINIGTSFLCARARWIPRRDVNYAKMEDGPGFMRNADVL